MDGEKRPRKMIWLRCAPLVSGSEMRTRPGAVSGEEPHCKWCRSAAEARSCIVCHSRLSIVDPRPLRHGLPLWTAPAPPPPEECPETEPSWKDRPADPDQHLAERVPLQPQVSTPIPRSLRVLVLVRSSLCYKIRQSCGELLTTRLDSAEETGQRPQIPTYCLGFPTSAH